MVVIGILAHRSSARPFGEESVSSPRSTMTLTLVAFWLLVVGGLNWLLVGLLRVDLVAAIFGTDSIAARVVYIQLGISAIICAATFGSLRRPAPVVSA